MPTRHKIEDLKQIGMSRFTEEAFTRGSMNTAQCDVISSSTSSIVELDFWYHEVEQKMCQTHTDGKVV